MLNDINARIKILTQLRPPEGYELSYALGTTFSLDLMTLLITPVSMALFEQDSGWEALKDPSVLLEAIRRTEGRICVFCQKGRIKVPTTDQKLLAYLESAVHEVDLGEIYKGRKGVFHPKVWVLRFTAKGEPTKYRVLCLSKNITFDRSWDVAVALEGFYRSDRSNGYPSNTGLCDFLNALPSISAVSEEKRKWIKKLADELYRVEFESPSPFEGFKFISLGIPDASPFNYSGYKRVLCVSPFLSYNALKPLTETTNSVLISRQEALVGLEKSEIDELTKTTSIYTMAVSADEALKENDNRDDQPTDLHAKVFVCEDGWNVDVFAGSANATNMALGRTGNIEFMTRLSGKKSKCGIEKILAARGSKSEDPLLSDIIEEYLPQYALPLTNEQKKKEELDNRLDEVRRIFCRLPLCINITIDKENTYCLKLKGACGAFFQDHKDVRIIGGPINIPESQRCRLTADPIALEFKSVPEAALSSFFAFTFSTKGKVGGKEIERKTSFVLNLPTDGMPKSRHQAIMRSALADKGAILRYLLFLLAENPEAVVWRNASQSPQGGSGGRVASSGSFNAILEDMVRAFSRAPEKLERVNSFLAEYGDLHDHPEMAPLSQIWPAFIEALGGEDNA